MAGKYKTFLSNEAWEAFREEYSTADDRSCAILGASYLHNCLTILVRAALAGSEAVLDELFADMAPLGTFSATTKMAYALNIIDDVMYRDMNLIRKIRNPFAHQVNGLSFTTDPIRKLCMELKFPEDWNGDHEELKDMLTDPRDRFIFTCSLVSDYFENRVHDKAKAIRNAILDVS